MSALSHISPIVEYFDTPLKAAQLGVPLTSFCHAIRYRKFPGRVASSCHCSNPFSSRVIANVGPDATIPATRRNPFCSWETVVECDLWREYVAHITQVHASLNLQPFGCTTCPATFATSEELFHHAFRMPTRGYFCKLCQFPFMLVVSIRSHVRACHPSVDLASIELLGSAAVWANQNGIIQSSLREYGYPVVQRIASVMHQKRLRFNVRQLCDGGLVTCEDVLHCGLCDRASWGFPLRIDLRRNDREDVVFVDFLNHFRGKHGHLALPFSCFVCQRGFADAKKFLRHILQLPNKGCVCTGCGKYGMTRSDFRYHRCQLTESKLDFPRVTSKSMPTVNSASNTFNAESSLPCENVGESTSTAELDKVDCKVADRCKGSMSPVLNCESLQTQTTEKNMCRNKKKYSIDTETGKLVCLICQKSYSNFKNLKEHIASNHDAKKINCSLCGTCFRNFKELAMHKRTRRGCWKSLQSWTGERTVGSSVELESSSSAAAGGFSARNLSEFSTGGFREALDPSIGKEAVLDGSIIRGAKRVGNTKHTTLVGSRVCSVKDESGFNDFEVVAKAESIGQRDEIVAEDVSGNVIAMTSSMAGARNATVTASCDDKIKMEVQSNNVSLAPKEFLDIKPEPEIFQTFDPDYLFGDEPDIDPNVTLGCALGTDEARTTVDADWAVELPVGIKAENDANVFLECKDETDIKVEILDDVFDIF